MADKLVSEQLFVTEVPICVDGVQPEPWHLYTLYPVTPTLSVEAVQERLIWDDETAVAERLVGTVGAWVSETLLTVTVIPDEVVRLLEVSLATAAKV